jgi:hypothetical protein
MSTYSPNLRIELITDGTQAGTWGSTTNGSLAYVLDSSIAGYQTVSVTAANQYLTYTNGATATVGNNQSVYAMLRFTTTTGAAFNVYALPSVSKQYLIWNDSGYSMTIYNSTAAGGTTALGTGVTIANGDQVLVWTNGTNFYELKTGNVTGTVAIANGGTGQTTASAAINALLPSQTGNVNKYLQTNGTVASWDAVSLSTSDITGTLGLANGGTGGTDAATARSSLGLGTMATQASGSVSITGGSITGITDLALADGGTGASDAATARTNLGLTIGTNVPSVAGTGATGTWGISISGTAANATNASFATNSTNATNALDATTAQNTRYGPGNNNSNIVNGASAFTARTIGLYNTVMGNFALRVLTSGNYNTAIGAQSMYSAIDATDNVAVGYGALYNSTSGDYNVAVGRDALLNSSGNRNTGVGYNAGLGIFTGAENTAVGNQSIYYQDNVSFSTGVGSASLISSLASLSNASAFGYDSTVTGNNQVQLGNASTTTYVYGTVQNRSDLRDKTDVRDTTLGLDFVMSLRPVDYKWDMRDFYRPAPPVRPEDPTDEQAMADFKTEVAAWRETAKLANITHDGSKKRTRYHHGFIAQEVMALNAEFGGIQDHKIAGGEDVLSLGYDEMIAPLVKAIQELKAEFDAYKAAHP